MVTIGQQLKRARTERDLSIEDVAFYTRIPAARVRDMENDDLSRFANLTYARGFLKIYGGYLELDLSDYLGQFHTEEFAHASGHEYVQTANATQNLPAAVFTDHGRAKSPGVYILLSAMAVAGGIVWWNNREVDQGSSAPAEQANAKLVSPQAPEGGRPAASASPAPAAGLSEQPIAVPPPPALVKTEVAASGSAPQASPLPEADPNGVPASAAKGTPPKAKVIEEQEP